ncbi:hypothetical protein FACS1894105_14470 [Clostridia bacterium]|nr:hypothetical protein FACS1894105_14470 [Clostridia bacterium]
MRIRESARLDAIAALTEGRIAADVGSDHGYLAVKLIQSGKCDKVYSLDISEIQVTKAQNNANRAGIIPEAIIFAQSDGLNYFANRRDEYASLTDIIIAGLGGETIVNIMPPLRENENIAPPKMSTEAIVCETVSA